MSDAHVAYKYAYKVEEKPFNNAIQFMYILRDFHSGWIKHAKTGTFYTVVSHTENSITLGGDGGTITLQDLAKNYVFADDESPCRAVND